MFCKYFLPVYCLSFHHFKNVFLKGNILNFGDMQFSKFLLMNQVLVSNLRTSCLVLNHKPFLIFSKNFIALYFKVIHFELIFVWVVRLMSEFIFLNLYG